MLSYVRSFSTTRWAFEAATKAAASTAGAKKPAAKKPAKKTPKEKTQRDLKKEDRPKRPAYPYMLYSASRWAEVSQGKAFKDVGKEMAKLWKEETPDVRAKFEEQYATAREAYQKDVEAWKAKWAKPLTGYTKFVKAEMAAKGNVGSKETAMEYIKEIAAKWSALSQEVKDQWKTK